MAEYEPFSEARAGEVIAAHAGREGAALVVLQAIQSVFGYVPPQAVAMTAQVLNLSRAEVHGTFSFYHDLREAPAGRRVVKVCRAESCQAMGGEAAGRFLLASLGIADFGGTSADGEVTVEAVYCLGLCAVSPAALVDEASVGRVDGMTLAEAVRGMTVVYVSKDSASLALGSEAVAQAFAEAGATVIRCGSRGAHWLEPMAEVETDEGRIAFGPIGPGDAVAILAGGADHPARLGRMADHWWMAGQTRVTFERCGVVDPLWLNDYDPFPGLSAARRIGAAATIEAITASGLRGRGGAGFPAGIKWKTVAGADAGQKYVVCNADEGDSGTFADRMLMEGDPMALIEGMAIAGFAVGADKGFVYSRSEYPHANRTLAEAIGLAHASGQLGDFRIELRVGAGAYVCGEETALLESLEGRRGQVRAKPPLPAHKGLFGRPTVVNNVLTLATAPWILAHGAEAYAALGYGRSRGTQPVQLAGNVKRPGLYEVPFGVTLGFLVNTVGGGTASGRPVKAVQCGGPLGAYFPPSLFDLPYDYEAFAAADGLVGHGGIVVFDDTADMAAQARWAFEFCAIESCGKCTPCRIGSVRGAETVQKVIDGRDVEANLALVEDLCHTLKFGSLCALGGFTPYPVMSAITHWPEDFRKRAIRLAGE